MIDPSSQVEHREHQARSAEEPFDYGNPAFCEPKEPVEDFGLSELLAVVEAPESGDLPFGPKTVGLDLQGGPVLATGESVGFWLISLNYGGRTPLHWILRNRIRTVDARGRAGQVISRGRTRVRTASAGDQVKLHREPPRDPGFYLYEIEIVGFDGRRLAKYGRHIRVERKFWDVRLGLNGMEFKPGDQVLNRIENFGTETLSYGEEFRVEAYKDGNWIPVRDLSLDGWLFVSDFSVQLRQATVAHLGSQMTFRLAGTES